MEASTIPVDHELNTLLAKTSVKWRSHEPAVVKPEPAWMNYPRCGALFAVASLPFHDPVRCAKRVAKGGKW